MFSAHDSLAEISAMGIGFSLSVAGSEALRFRRFAPFEWESLSGGTLMGYKHYHRVRPKQAFVRGLRVGSKCILLSGFTLHM